MGSSLDNLLSMSLGAVAFNPEAPGSPAVWIDYTPDGGGGDEIPAVVEPISRELIDGNFLETRKITVKVSDVSDPREKDIAVIDGESWAVESILEQSAVTATLRMKRTRRHRKEMGKPTY